MMDLARLRRLTRDELTWRSTAHARIAARRLETRLRQPRWNRDDLPRVLAEHVSDPTLRQAIAARDWMAAHHALAAAIRARPARFVLDPSTQDDMRRAISNRWPSAAAAAAERADRILAGHYDLLGYRGLTFARPGKGCRDAGFDPKVAYRINDCQMAQTLVAAGEGIALLPRLMLRPANPGVAIKPLATDPPTRRVSALRLSTRYLTPATERFLALLVAASTEYGAT